MSAADERRAAFKRYKEDVEREGKPFFPYAMFHDTVMSLVVVAVIIALACIWYFTADGTTPGEIGPWYSEERPTPGRRTSSRARLVLLLPLLPAPDLQVAGDGGPRHGRHPDDPDDPPVRAAVPRPAPGAPAVAARSPVIAAVLTAVSMGVLTYKGATRARRSAAKRSLQVDELVEQQGGFSPEARRGAEIFAQVGCLQCHVYLGSGSANVGAPELSDIGAVRAERRLLQALRREPGGVREQRDAGVREPRRREPARGRDVPRRVEGRVEPPMHVVPA